MNNTITDKHFIDWEGSAFGYGYGTGEEPILTALKSFFGSLEDGRNYHHDALEELFRPIAAWLLINALCHADVIEYGTSARHGWLTKKGEILRDYMADKTVDQLYSLLLDRESTPCYPDHCNCDTPCNNPLFK